MNTPKSYTLEARLGKKRVTRKFLTRDAAEAEAKALAQQHPEWSAKDYITITTRKS